MTITDNEGKKIEITVGCFLGISKSNKNIFFLDKDGKKICLDPKNGKMILIKDVKTRDDFISLAKFFGKLFLLRGEPVEDGEDYYLWKFTYPIKGDPNCCMSPKTLVTYESKEKFISFYYYCGKNEEGKDMIGRAQLHVPFLKSPTGYRRLLNVISLLYGHKNRRIRKATPEQQAVHRRIFV